jgi:phenylacetate-CoA ligase
MHALAVIYVLRAVEGIAEFKLIQHALRDVEVLVVPDGRWSEACHAKVMVGLAARLGNEVRIRIRLVEAIPVEASGKYRYVVSRVALPPGLDPALQAIESAQA